MLSHGPDSYGRLPGLLYLVGLEIAPSVLATLAGSSPPTAPGSFPSRTLLQFNRHNASRSVKGIALDRRAVCHHAHHPLSDGDF